MKRKGRKVNPEKEEGIIKKRKKKQVSDRRQGGQSKKARV